MGPWRVAHAALLALLASWAAASSLLSTGDPLRFLGAALVVAAGLEAHGLRSPHGGARAAALALVVLAYLPAALATEQPALLLLGFASLALLAAVVGSAPPLEAWAERQRISARAGTAGNPGGRPLATLGATILASYLLSILLLGGGLLLVPGQASDWSLLLASLALLAVVAILASLPRGREVPPGRRGLGEAARRP